MPYLQRALHLLISMGVMISHIMCEIQQSFVYSVVITFSKLTYTICLLFNSIKSNNNNLLPYITGQQVLIFCKQGFSYNS